MHLATFLESAETLMGRLDGSPTVAGIVPSGFDRYLRILDPVRVSTAEPVAPLELSLPWSLICEQLGVELRPNTMWRRDVVAADPRITGFEQPGPGLSVAERDVRMPLGKLLQRHETEDRSWHFAMWVGFGVTEGERPVWFPSHQHNSLEMSVFERWNEAGTAFEMPVVPSAPGSATLLSEVGSPASHDYTPPGQVPMYWWPEGHDWVLALPLYASSVYLACSHAIADEVLQAPGIEVIEVGLADEADHEE